MLRFLRNLRGRIGKYGKCSDCGDRWNWKTPLPIIYRRSDGAMYRIAPLCKECFEKLAIEGTHGIMHFINESLTLDIAFCRPLFPQDEVDRMLKFIRREVEKQKGIGCSA